MRTGIEVSEVCLRRNIGRERRRGSVVLVTLNVVIVVTILAGGLVQLYRLHQMQLENAKLRLQADLYLTSGIERAIMRLRADPNYTGEIWFPRGDGDPTPAASDASEAEAPPDMSDTLRWRVRIEVRPADPASESADGAAERRHVSVTVTRGTDDTDDVMLNREVTTTLPKPQ